SSCFSLLIEHDVFRKPVPTFRHHALGSAVPEAHVNLRYVLPALMLLATHAVAAAPAAPPVPDPKGDWLVNDGTAVIHIAPCPETPPATAAATAAAPLCATIAWTKSPPGLDENNPDPKKRERSIMGMAILIAMKPDRDGRFEGEIYNAENG